jgi:hypothetical protein
MRKLRRYSAVPLVMFLAVPYGGADGPPPSSDKGRIPVYVKAASTTGGFTDPDKARADSTKDLISKLKDSKTLTLAAEEDKAIIVLEVLSRDTKYDEAHAMRAILGGPFGQKKSSVSVRLTAGEYSTEFTSTGGSSGVFSGYGKAASKMVKELDAWVKANDAKLREIVAQKAQASAAPTVAPVPSPAPVGPPAAEPGPVAEPATAPSPSPQDEVASQPAAPSPVPSPSPQ